jgi:hypothetical protein
MRGASRAEGIPLRLRDPVAYQRKLANAKMAREQGALPRAMTHHRSTGGTGISSQSTRGGFIGGTKGSTRMPRVPKMGTNMNSGVRADRLARGAIGDPLGTSDPLVAKAQSLSRTEILSLKNKIQKLLDKLNKLTKSSPVLDEHSKKGGQASSERSSAPTGPTEVRDEDSAGYRFDDTSLAFNIVSKR